MSDDSVYWSVMEANRQRGNRTVKLRVCQCGTNEWHVRNDVNPKYRSQYNPGECVIYTCSNCGYSFEVAS